MVQNIGELMMYIGGALCLLYPIGALIINLLFSATRGKFRPTSTMGIVLGLAFLTGGVLTFVGDSYRKDISKDVIVSYYNENISYEQLTSAQQKNIDCAFIDIVQMKKEKKDILKYIPAFEKYITEKAIADLGYSKERAEEYAKEWLLD